MKTSVWRFPAGGIPSWPFLAVAAVAISVSTACGAPSQEAYLKASNTGTFDYFGQSIAVSGDTMIVGAPFEGSNSAGVNGDENNNNAPSSGAVYVFIRMGTNWSQQAYLKASNTESIDQFGGSVAISGDTVVVGAISERSRATGVNGDQGDNSIPYAGAAYIFVRNGTNWSQQAYLKASNTRAFASFGDAVTVSGDTVVVGAFGESSGATGVNGNQSDSSAFGAGAAYVFVRDGTSWSQQAYLKASNAEGDDNFGASVALSGNTLVVGAAGESSDATGVNGNESDNSASGAGAAYVFVRDGTNWSQQAYLKASNAETNDSFGASVAAAGDTVVVGATGESSHATGVNGDQSDKSAPGSGAAYVFVRTGTNWSQQAYLKASNTEAGDGFGAVGLASDTVAVAARAESSSSTGVNGNQGDNAAPGSGAAYVFVRSGTNWTQQAYLKASNAEANDNFGTAVAVGGGTVVVGAIFESSSATGVNGDQANNGAAGSGAAYVFTGFSLVLDSRLAIEADGGGGYFVRVSGSPNASYQVQRAPGVTGPWDTLATLSASPGGLLEYHDTNPPAGQAFYRTVR